MKFSCMLLLNQAVIDELIPANPALTVCKSEQEENKEYSEELLFMTEEEIAELLHFFGRILSTTCWD